MEQWECDNKLGQTMRNLKLEYDSLLEVVGSTVVQTLRDLAAEMQGSVGADILTGIADALDV